MIYRRFLIGFLYHCCIYLSTDAIGIQVQGNSSLITARDGGWGWGSSVGSQTSYFDIALTALAFLAFGIFLLNLLFNALFFTPATTGITTTGPIVTTTGGGGTMTGGTGSGAALYRGKRSLDHTDVDSVTAANILAESVLNSIDSMTEKHECLPKLICDGNRQAQLMGHGFGILMPIYSISSSYIGRKFGFLHGNLSDHVDAILDGLTEPNCRTPYPHCR